PREDRWQGTVACSRPDSASMRRTCQSSSRPGQGAEERAQAEQTSGAAAQVIGSPGAPCCGRALGAATGRERLRVCRPRDPQCYLSAPATSVFSSRPCYLLLQSERQSI